MAKVAAYHAATASRIERLSVVNQDVFRQDRANIGMGKCRESCTEQETIL